MSKPKIHSGKSHTKHKLHQVRLSVLQLCISTVFRDHVFVILKATTTAQTAFLMSPAAKHFG